MAIGNNRNRRSGAVTNMVSLVVFSCLFLALVGCGGGGGGGSGGAGESPAPVLSPAGIWYANGLTDWNFEAVVLDTGEYFFIYTDSATGNSSGTGGLVHGTAKLDGRKLSSSDGLDFNFEGAGIVSRSLDATTATYTPLEDRASLNGSVTVTDDPSNSRTFTSISDPHYYQTPSLEAVAGAYDGHLDSVAEPEFFKLSIGNAGDIAATGSSGCVATGTITPHSSGNLYNTQITFGPAPCGQPNKTVSGVGVYHRNPENTVLLLGLVDSGRTFGMVFWGAKDEDFDSDGDEVVDGNDADDDNDDIADVDDVCPLDPSPYCPMEITETQFGDGKEWAQVYHFSNTSLKQVATACPGGACSGVLNGYVMDGWIWASIDDVCALFNSYAGSELCHIEGSIDQQVLQDFFADGWLVQSAPYDPMETLQQLSGYVRPGVYGNKTAFFTYPSCGALYYTNGYDLVSEMGCRNTGIVPPARLESVGAWFFRPL